jgi:DNA repair photolyase
VDDPDFLESLKHVQSIYLLDDSQSVVGENDSPDISFRFSLNPHRGCRHGCSYCYARPTYEYLGMNSGIDFESKIVVKRRPPELFRTFLGKSSWQPELIVLFRVTDSYQSSEREFKLTRACLGVAIESRQPLSIITKIVFVTRDVDLLR